MTQVQIDETKLAEIAARGLSSGNHDGPTEGAWVMEVVSYVTGEAWSDEPACASPMIASFAIRLNDSRRFTEYRNELLAFVPAMRIAGTRIARRTRGSEELEIRRAFAASDWAVRVIAPMALRAAGLTEQADTLAALPEIVDRETAARARNAAYDAATAARARNAATDWAAADAAANAAYAAAIADVDATDAAKAAVNAAADAAAAYPAAKREIWNSALAMLGRLCDNGKDCPECGTRFGGHLPPSQLARRVYCSRACAGKQIPPTPIRAPRKRRTDVIGGVLSVRLGDLLPRVDALAESKSTTRASIIRTLIEMGLDEA